MSPRIDAPEILFVETSGETDGERAQLLEGRLGALMRTATLEEALHLAAERTFDLVIVDASGHALERLGEAFPDTPIVTESRASREQLRISEARLSLAQSRGRIGYWELELASHRLHWSEQMFNLFGREPREGMPSLEQSFDYYDTNDRRLLRTAVDQLLNAGEPFELEATLVRRGGDRLEVSSSAAPIRVAGKLVGLRGTVQDISERKRAEAALARERDNFRAVISAAPVPLVAIDEFGRVASVNPAAERLFGAPAASLLHREYAEVMGCGPSGPCRTLRELVARALAGRPSGEQVELAMPRADQGKRRLVVTVESLVLDELPHAILALQDVTHLRETEAERNALEHDLRHVQRLEAVGSLVGGIAHDFNNLVAVIRSLAELAAEDAPERVREDLKEIDGAATRAAELTQQLLAFSRKDAARPTPVDVGDVVRGLERWLKRIVGEDIELSLDLAHHPAVARVDRSDLEHVILNLVVNARDAMPRGGSLLVQTRLGPHDEPEPWIEVSITDTGSGMDAATRARIFEPFFTTKERGRGTGLGLATVLKIVQRAGGQVLVDSAIDIGSRFRVRLPRAEGAPAPESVRPREARGAAHETVLIVEDEDAVRTVARRILEADGFRVLTAASGHEALDLVRSQGEAIDLVLSDVVMPEMDGEELANRIRHLMPQLPILLMTGYTNRAPQEAGFSVLAKPFDASGLRRKVREVLKAR